MVLHSGKISEMATGEGVGFNTASLLKCKLQGQGVHIETVMTIWLEGIVNGCWLCLNFYGLKG
jgi:hypothetical protein